MKHPKLLLTGAVALATWSTASALVGDARDEVEKRTYRAVIGEPAPDFELPTADGKSWKLADQRGKVVVLEWFNPDCPYVVEAHKEGGPLATLGNRAAKEGVAWVAINSGHRGNASTGSERNKKAAQELGIEYPILLDESSWVGAAYGAKTTPHVFVIDAKGVLAYAGAHAARESGENLVEPVLAQLAKGAAVAEPKTENFGCGVKYPPRAELDLLAPPFELEDSAGNAIDLASFRGQVVVLEWFNPECPVVKAAHDKGGPLDGTAARWAEQGVAWIAVNSGGAGKQGAGAEKNERAKKAWSLAHPIVLDESGKVGKAYGAATTPHMYVLDERGVLVYRGGHADRSGAKLVDQALTELTSGKKISQPDTQNFGCSVKYAD